MNYPDNLSPEDEFVYENSLCEGHEVPVGYAKRETRDWENDTLYPVDWGETGKVLLWVEKPDWKVIRYSRRGEEVIVAFLKDRNGLPYIDGAYVEEVDESYAERYSAEYVNWEEPYIEPDPDSYLERQLDRIMRETAAKLRPDYLKGDE